MNKLQVELHIRPICAIVIDVKYQVIKRAKKLEKYIQKLPMGWDGKSSIYETKCFIDKEGR